MYAMKSFSNSRSFRGADIGDMQVHHALRYNVAAFNVAACECIERLKSIQFSSVRRNCDKNRQFFKLYITFAIDILLDNITQWEYHSIDHQKITETIAVIPCSYL